MFLLDIIIFFILGTIIGSFLNVLVLRYKTGLSFMKGRSKCFSCGKTLSWYELVPVLSFIFIKGKCTDCKSKISIQYPLVEFATGILFSLVFWKVGLSVILFPYLIVFSLLIAIFIYDFGHKIIPFIFLISSIGLGGFLNSNNLLEILSGPILFSFFAFFWLISGGRWMGFGDAKLALGVGWFLGFSGGVFAILLAFWIGAIWSIFIIILGKLNIYKNKLTIKSEVPFAPFILFGLLIVFLTSWNLTNLFYLLAVQ